MARGQWSLCPLPPLARRSIGVVDGFPRAPFEKERVLSGLELFPPCVAGIQVVPVFDLVFVLFPAKEYFAFADDGREID